MYVFTLILYPTKALVQLGGEIKKWAEAKQFTIPTLADTVSSATPLTLLYCLHTIHCHQKKGPITKIISKACNTRIRKGWHTSYCFTGNTFPKLSGLRHTKPALRRTSVHQGLLKHKEKYQNLNFKSSFHYNNTDVPMTPDTMGLYLYCFSQDPLPGQPKNTI